MICRLLFKLLVSILEGGGMMGGSRGTHGEDEN